MQDGEDTLGDAEEIALAQELDRLAEQIESVTCELEDCRRETSQLRAQAASVSVSFESAREELQNILQSESGIQANSAQPPPPPDDMLDSSLVAGPAFDQAVLCGVKGQLEATKASVQKAVLERDELLRQIHESESELLSPEGASMMSQVYLDIPAISISEKKPTPDEGKSAFDLDLIQRLSAQTASRSSFRDDHARIWRDSTFPNICLLKLDESSTKTLANPISCGVVSERVFSGTTTYTSTNSSGDVQDEYQLSNCGKPGIMSHEDFELAKTQYASLVLEDLSINPDVIKVIAPRQALEKVVRLVEKANANASLPNSRPITPSIAPISSKAAITSPKVSQVKVKHLTPETSLRQTRPGPRLSTASEVLEPDYLNFLVSKCVPHRFQECDFVLKYSTSRDGMSVHTLFRTCENISPTIVALKDTKGRVFGCYAASPWKSSSMRYYGTGESFVFSCKPILSAYKWTRNNHFFQFSHGNILAMGGGTGSHFALWVDEDLRTGTTSACSTFDSPPLTNDLGDSKDRIDFDILTLEVWTIVPRSHHTFDESGGTP